MDGQRWVERLPCGSSACHQHGRVAECGIDHHRPAGGPEVRHQLCSHAAVPRGRRLPAARDSFSGHGHGWQRQRRGWQQHGRPSSTAPAPAPADGSVEVQASVAGDASNSQDVGRQPPGWSREALCSVRSVWRAPCAATVEPRPRRCRRWWCEGLRCRPRQVEAPGLCGLFFFRPANADSKPGLKYAVTCNNNNTRCK